MFGFPTGFGSIPSVGLIPDPASFGATFSGLESAIPVWLGVAAAVCVILLAFSVRRTDRERVQITRETIELREAA